MPSSIGTLIVPSSLATIFTWPEQVDQATKLVSERRLIS